MRVLDIITENVSPLQTGRIGTQNLRPISQNNHMPNQVVMIKQALKRHRLIVSRNASGRQEGGMAWTGDETEDWSPALNEAIRNWKRSINLQVPPHRENSPLEISNPPTLKDIDIEYLEQRRLDSRGLLVGDNARQPVVTRGPLEGLTYEREIPGTRDDAIDTSSLLNAVGHSAWWRICTEILDYNNSSDGVSWLDTTDSQEVGAETRNLFLRVYNQNNMPFASEAWLTDFNRIAGRAMATYLDGSQQPIAYAEEVAPDTAEIFDYYADMAEKLWEKDRAKEQERDRQRDTGESFATTTTATLSDAELRTIANNLNDAMENKTLAVLPGGRGFFNDKEAIQVLLARLGSAKDWDDLSNIYESLFSEKLHERLYEELDKPDYLSIVTSRLIGLRRCAPSILHASINFAQEENIQTDYEGKTYKILKEMPIGGDHAIENYNGYDAIVIDGIYRAAVQSTGGMLPDFDAAPADEKIDEARLVFINTINTTYPEMVAFYVRAQPFDQASVDLGGARLNTIIEDAARLITSPDEARRFITDQVKADRAFLTGEDGGEPAANIYFDEKYRGEGLADREFERLSADAEVELNGGEETFQDRLLSSDAQEVRAAVDELLQEQDAEQMYVNIYRDTAASGKFLDMAENMGDGENDVKEFVLSSTNSNSPLLRIATTIGLAKAAPAVMAELFHDAITAGLIAGTDEDLMDGLVAQLKTREDYELVDERYRNAPVNAGDSLIDDVAGEQLSSQFGYGWYGQLARLIGDEARVEALRVELEPDMIDAIQDVEANPTMDHINKLQSKLDSRNFRSNEDQLELVIDRLTAALEDFQDTSSAEYLALYDFVQTLQEAYDNL